MSATLSHRITTHVRWMIRRDMPEVLSAELAGTADPWQEDDFLRVLRQRNNIGMVAEYRDTVVGHVVYHLRRESLEVLRLAVDRDFRRMGVGVALMTKLFSKLSPGRRSRLVIDCPETCDDVHWFLRSLGIPAKGVIRGDGGPDLYRFVATCEPPPPGALVDCGEEEVGRG